MVRQFDEQTLNGGIPLSATRIVTGSAVNLIMFSLCSYLYYESVFAGFKAQAVITLR